MTACRDILRVRWRTGLGLLGAAILLGGLTGIVLAQGTDFVPLPQGAAVKILEPKDGATVKSPFKVVFSVSGAQIKPAGPPEAGTGHHHLLIDLDAMPAGQVTPADATHIHYGKGQTEAVIELSSGEHKLTLQFADGLHRSYGPVGSHTIKVRVLGY
jgi:hypothetical protein